MKQETKERKIYGETKKEVFAAVSPFGQEQHILNLLVEAQEEIEAGKTMVAGNLTRATQTISKAKLLINEFLKVDREKLERHNAEAKPVEPTSYSNRFGEMELQPDGSWIVTNLVTGLFIGDRMVGFRDEQGNPIPTPKSFTKSEAKSELTFMLQHYKAME